MICTLHDGCPAEPEGTVLRWMRGQVEDYRDRVTGEPNYTALAEAAAHRFDHDDWLDDEQSDVWDLAIEAFDDGGEG